MKPHAALMVVLVCLSLTTAQAGTIEELGLNRLLDAIASVESNRNAGAVGDSGRAIGCYQLHERYWKDGTRILGVNWTYDLAKDPVKSRQVVRAYLLHYGKGKTLLEKARIHNGGPQGYKKKATLRYARKIARILEQGTAAS
jgi:hypothetical protein